jgi:hypothetical protein
LKPLDLLREDLQGILATKEYHIYTQENKSILQDLFDGLKNWLNKILQNIFPHADVAKRTSEWLSYGIAALGLLLLFLMLFLLLSRFVRHGQVHSKHVSMAKGQTLTAQRHLAEAHKLAEAGNYSSALRLLFLGSILYLNQNQWIEAKVWKTNWEYYAELKDRAPQLANSFYTLAVKFEEAMYGGRPIARDDYWLYHNQVNKWIHEGDTR